MVKKILKTAKLSFRKSAPLLECSESAAMAKLSRGLASTDDLILLCDNAGIELSLKYQSGEIINLTKDDI